MKNQQLSYKSQLIVVAICCCSRHLPLTIKKHSTIAIERTTLANMPQISNRQLVIAELEVAIQHRQRAATVRLLTEDSDDSSNLSGTIEDLIDASLVETYNKVLSTRYIERPAQLRVNNCRTVFERDLEVEEDGMPMPSSSTTIQSL